MDILSPIVNHPIVFSVLGAMLIAGIMLELLVGADSWSLPKQRGVALIVGKSFLPCTQDWQLHIEVDGLRVKMSVEKSFFRSSLRGDKVNVEYTIGRFSKRLYFIEKHS